MAVTVEPEGLGSDGATLAGSQVLVAVPECVPPGADTTSVGAVAQLTTQSAVLAALLNHAGMVRAQGGAVVGSTAASLQAADEQGASAIAASTGTAMAASAVGGDPVIGELAPPASPALPSIPSIPPLIPLPGHVYSAQLHAGPGPDSMRAFAHEWRSHAATTETLAAQTQQVAAGIADHWVDGYHRAASNTARHSDWLESAAGQARSLADLADSVANHFQDAKTRTPTPDDFARTEQWRQSAIARNIASGGLDSAEVAEATAMLARQQAEATEAAGAYHTGVVTDALSHVATPIPPAPDIGHGNDKPADDLPTDKRLPRRLPRIDEEIQPLDVPGHNDEGLGGTLTGETSSSKSEPTNIDGTELPTPGFWSTPTDRTSAMDPQEAGDARNATGTEAGLGALSQLGQLANMPSTGAGAMPGVPMSGLPAMPSLGGMSSAPSSGLPTGDPGVPQPDTGLTADAIPDNTSPAGGGGGGGGTSGGLPAMSNALPAAGTSSPTAAAPTTPAAATPTASSGGGAMGMYPPLMGHAGRGENDSTDRDKRLYPDKRVVLREVPNTEAVFGELAQEARRRPNRLRDQEEAQQ